jgi:hypothetical protein
MTDTAGQLETAHDVNTNPAFVKLTDGTDEVDVITEDAAHASGVKSLALLGVRADSIGTLVDTDGDYHPVLIDANGRLYVLEKNSADILTAVQLIDDIVHDEDAVHTTGDSGAAMLVVRKDTAASLCDTDGDYTLLIVDANGYLHVKDPNIASLTHAEDSVHNSGDDGIMALAVRKDTATQLAGTDGDYSPLITDANGRLHTQEANSTAILSDTTDIKTAVEIIDDIVLTEDAVHGSGDKGVMLLGVRKDSIASMVDTDGDYHPVLIDANGRVYVLEQNSTAILADTTAIKTAVELIDDTIAAEGAAASKGIQISLDDGTDTQFAQCNATGDLKVTLDSETVAVSDAPPTTILDGKKTVTLAATPEALAGSTACQWVTVTNDNDDNAGRAIYVGNASSQNTVLRADQSMTLYIDDLDAVYVKVTQDGDKAAYTGGA